MSLTDIILLAIALGIDCLVVSFSQGLIFDGKKMADSLKLAVTMGLFQGLMPCIGYNGAEYIYEYAAPFRKWIVFGIFLLLGIKFIMEAFETQKKEIRCIGFGCLISLGIATSIDALVAGASLKFTYTPLVIPAVIIGIAAFIMSLSGFWFSSFFKKFPPKYLEITGGVILIFLAAKSIIF